MGPAFNQTCISRNVTETTRDRKNVYVSFVQWAGYESRASNYNIYCKQKWQTHERVRNERVAHAYRFLRRNVDKLSEKPNGTYQGFVLGTSLLDGEN